MHEDADPSSSDDDNEPTHVNCYEIMVAANKCMQQKDAARQAPTPSLPGGDNPPAVPSREGRGQASQDTAKVKYVNGENEVWGKYSPNPCPKPPPKPPQHAPRRPPPPVPSLASVLSSELNYNPLPDMTELNRTWGGGRMVPHGHNNNHEEERIRETFRSVSIKRGSKESKESIESKDPVENDDPEIYAAVTSVYQTLEDSLMKQPPLPDTLKLDHRTRGHLCQFLYVKEEWKVFAEYVGLHYENITIIGAFARFHNHTTAAELVLRFWQYRYNKYGIHRDKCPYPCDKDGLIDILKKMDQNALVEHVEQSMKP